MEFMIAAVVFISGAVFLYLRLSLLSLRWPRGLLNKQIALRCRRYLRLKGINAKPLSYFYFDLEVNTNTLEFPIGSFFFCCMDEQYFAGSLCFASMRQEQLLTLQSQVDSKTSEILVLLTPSEVTGPLVALGETFGIPVLHTTDLREFAEAILKAQKTRSPLKYEGRSLLLRSIIETRISTAERFKIEIEAARVCQRLGEWCEAEKHWRACLSLVARPAEHAEAQLGLATAVAALGREREADEIFRQAIRDNPNHVGLAEGYAKSATSRGDIKEAQLRWRKVIDTFPESWCGYRGMIGVLFESGNKDAAFELLRKESALRRRNPDAAHDVARWAERLGNWEEAEAAWRRFIHLDNRYEWSYKDLAHALAKQGKVREAEKILRGARKRFPAQADLTVNVSN
jgi:tetratricopeptide (TPR) repeat protein